MALSAAGLLAVAGLSAVAAACLNFDRSGFATPVTDGVEWCIDIDGTIGLIDTDDPLTQVVPHAFDAQFVEVELPEYGACHCYREHESDLISGVVEGSDPVTNDFNNLRTRLEGKLVIACESAAAALSLTNPNCTDVNDAILNTFDPPWRYALNQEPCTVTQIVDADSDGIATEGAGGALPDPASVITDLGNDEYEVDADFFDDMKSYPEQLSLDSARIQEDANGKFYMRDIETTDIAYHLGFRNGDKLLKVNDEWVTGWSNAIMAWQAVHNDTAFEVKIQRGVTYMTLEYTVN